MNKIFDDTMQSLNDMLEYVKGDTTKGKVRTREFKPIQPIKEYSGKEIKEIREKSHFTQAYLGEILGVSVKTIQAWEGETNRPSGAAKRMLQIIEKNPAVLEELEIISK